MNVGRAAFGFRANRAELEVVFVIDVAPNALLIGVSSARPYAFRIDVTDGCEVVPHLKEHYGKLLDALGIEPNPANPFGTIKFFRQLDDHVPQRPSGVFQSPELVARLWNDFEESDKSFFVGWVAHNDGRHVTAGNLAKTDLLLGRDVADFCRRHNISSRWSALPRDKNPVTSPPVR